MGYYCSWIKSYTTLSPSSPYSNLGALSGARFPPSTVGLFIKGLCRHVKALGAVYLWVTRSL